VYDFFVYSVYLVLLVNLLLYSFSFFRKEKANVFFVSYLVFSFLMQFSMELMYIFKLNNLPFLNVFFIGQMILLGLFYNSLLKLKSQKIFVKVSIVVALLILIIQCALDPSQFLKFNMFEIALTCLLIVVFALFHLYNMLTEAKMYYYASIGIIIYLFASTVLFLIGNLSFSLSEDLKYLIWTLNAFLALAYQFFILYEWKVSFYNKSLRP